MRKRLLLYVVGLLGAFVYGWASGGWGSNGATITFMLTMLVGMAIFSRWIMAEEHPWAARVVDVALLITAVFAIDLWHEPFNLDIVFMPHFVVFLLASTTSLGAVTGLLLTLLPSLAYAAIIVAIWRVLATVSQRFLRRGPTKEMGSDSCV